MTSEDGQAYSVCILQFSCFTKYNRMQSKHKQTKSEHSRGNSYSYSFLSRYHYNKSKNYLKDDIKFVTEFPGLLGHPVYRVVNNNTCLCNLFKL